MGSEQLRREGRKEMYELQVLEESKEEKWIRRVADLSFWVGRRRG